MSISTEGNRAVVERYYALMDSGRLHEACGMFVDDVKLTFGNAEPIYGPNAAEAAIQFVIDLTSKIQHEVVGFWEFPNPDGTTTAIFELSITYTLKDGPVITNPGLALGILDLDGRFVEQRLYGGLNLAELG
jgi:hypothetical protein